MSLHCEGFYRDKFNVKSHGTPELKGKLRM